jgi:lipid A 3-O-deacylase PagL
MRRLLSLMLVAASPMAGAADPELGVWLGRAADSHETDVARLTYRRSLSSAAQTWWRPQQLQFGVGVWRVPDLGGITRRYDASMTPIWRSESAFGYVEGGIGVYLLSHTINNDTTRLPSALQFGSHVGAGLSFDKAKSDWRCSTSRMPASKSRTAASTSTCSR